MRQVTEQRSEQSNHWGEHVTDEEGVIFPLPSQEDEISTAAAQYEDQYHVNVLIQVRGHVTSQQNIQCEIADWYTFGDVDPELDLVGLGEAGADSDALVWVIPSGPGENARAHDLGCVYGQSPWRHRSFVWTGPPGLP